MQVLFAKKEMQRYIIELAINPAEKSNLHASAAVPCQTDKKGISYIGTQERSYLQSA